MLSLKKLEICSALKVLTPCGTGCFRITTTFGVLRLLFSENPVLSLMYTVKYNCSVFLVWSVRWEVLHQ